MPITVSCKCGQKLRANDEHAGNQAKCPKCGALLTLAGPRVPALDVFVSYSTKDKRRMPSAPLSRARGCAAGSRRETYCRE